MISKNNRFIKFVKDKGFYIVLAVCIIGASIGAWATANKTLNTIDEHNKQLTEQYVQNEVKKWESGSKSTITNPPQSQKPVENNSSVATNTKKDNVKKPVPSSSSSSSVDSPSTSTLGSKELSKSQVTEQKLEQTLYILPMDSLAVIEPYSNGELVKNETLNVWRVHNAVDLKGEAGDRVCAVSDGVIIDIGVDPLWGGYVEIKHPDGCQSKYTGITAEKSLKKNDNVTGGQKIGTLSDIPAESKKGIHLHFSMTRNKEYVDPAMYLPLKEENIK